VIEIVEPGRVIELGDRGCPKPITVSLHVHSPRFYSRLLRGSIGLCDSYMDGLWDCDDLVGLTRIAALNVGSLDTLRRLLAPVLVPMQRTAGMLARNTPGRSRRRIAAHYDLGNDLFELFLDPTMMYSCAVFDPPDATLEDASLAKLERVCAKLDLGPDDHVLEIGTGWGGFAVYAARHRGCRVTTTTISREQHAYAVARVREAGLQDRVTVLLEDYRDLRGSYDKLVSIEMIEAVGWEYLTTFFRCCSRLLREDGAMLLQAIVIDDRAYEVEKGGRSFITTHYATTLAHWRERFHAGSHRLAGLGYDERFRRLWELYLCYCEGGFRERRIQDVQLVLAKPDYRGEPLHAIAAPAGADLAAA
jgi:cyclopropane-fatty-acyl-phospholipid synthase